jgi:hypothetical protein
MLAARPSTELASEELDAESEERGRPTDRTGELPVVSDRGPVFCDARVARWSDDRFGLRAEEIIVLPCMNGALRRLWRYWGFVSCRHGSRPVFAVAILNSSAANASCEAQCGCRGKGRLPARARERDGERWRDEPLRRRARLRHACLWGLLALFLEAPDAVHFARQA